MSAPKPGDMTDEQLHTAAAAARPYQQEINRRADVERIKREAEEEALRVKHGVAIVCPTCEGNRVHHHHSDHAAPCGTCSKTGRLLVPSWPMALGLERYTLGGLFPAFGQLQELTR